MICAKDLRHAVTFEQREEVKNATGGLDVNWVAVVSTWVKITPLSGRETFKASKIQSEVTHSVVMRYLAGITPKLRIRFGDRYFDIKSVLNVEERNIELNLLVEEGAGT